jgi:hypothetical protein
MINFEKFQLLRLVTSEPFGGKIQNLSEIRKKSFVFAILSIKVGIFRREHRKMPFSTQVDFFESIIKQIIT